MPTGYILALNCPACPSEAKTIAQDPISPLALKSELTTVRRAIALILEEGFHYLPPSLFLFLCVFLTAKYVVLYPLIYEARKQYSQTTLF